MHTPEIADVLAKTQEEKRELSIWFFCGLLTFVYGIMLVGQGFYDLSHPPNTVLQYLHPTLKWGALMTLVGAFYVVRFRPGKG